MFKEMIELETIYFAMPTDELFQEVLAMLNRSNLWPKELDSEKRSITVAGNIKVRRTDEILKNTTFGGRFGMSLILPLSSLSKTMMFDRICIQVRQKAPGYSSIHFYGRMGFYARIGNFPNQRIYSKKYDENYYELRQLFEGIGHEKADTFDAVAKIREKLDKKTIMMPYFSVFILWFVFLLAGMITLHIASLGSLGKWGGYLGAAIIVTACFVCGYKLIRSMFT